MEDLVPSLDFMAAEQPPMSEQIDVQERPYWRC